MRDVEQLFLNNARQFRAHSLLELSLRVSVQKISGL